MSSAAAVQVAVRLAEQAGEPNPTDMTQMEGTFAQTQAVLGGQDSISETPETKEWLRSDTYLTVMHGHFTASRVAPGSTPVQAGVMAVIADSHTGWLEGRYIGPNAPVSAALKPVAAPVPSAGRETMATAARSNARGVILGRLIQSVGLPFRPRKIRPLVGWPVLIGKGPPPFRIDPNVVASVRTGADGRFAVRVKPGKYLVAGVWRAGTPSAGERCGAEPVTVRSGRRSRVLISCGGR
jgi:hypothetical protein